MRVFIILSLAAVVCADVGYNYKVGSGSHVIGGHSGHSGHSGHDGSSGLGSHDGSSLGRHTTSIALVGLGGGSGGSKGLGGIGDSKSSVSVSPATPVTYEKEFYTFSAPENEFNNDNAGQEIVNVKKNLRVIFIKAPENKGLGNAAAQLVKQAAVDKTAIYVLTKQPDFGNLAQQLQTVQSQQNKRPEVHFVKYRTPGDASNAQKAIQAEYEQLSGTSQSHNGGVAPVLNFASPAQIAEGPAPKAPANAYLPSSVLRLFRA